MADVAVSIPVALRLERRVREVYNPRANVWDHTSVYWVVILDAGEDGGETEIRNIEADTPCELLDKLAWNLGRG